MTLGSRSKIVYLAAVTACCIAGVLWFRRSSAPKEEMEALPIQSETAAVQTVVTSKAPAVKFAPRAVSAFQTNNEEAELVRKITVQRELVAALEAETYTKDPYLQVYEKFRNDPQQWFTTNFGRGMDPLSTYLHADDPSKAKKREKVCQDLRSLFGVSNTKELAEDPQYTHLLATTYEFLARLQASKKGEATWDFPANRLIGWQEPVSQEKLTGDQMLEGCAKRYELVNQKIAELVLENQIPEDTVAYIRGKSISQCLTGAADIYMQTHTPPELSKMRYDLRHLEILLHNLRKQKSELR